MQTRARRRSRNDEWGGPLRAVPPVCRVDRQQVFAMICDPLALT